MKMFNLKYFGIAIYHFSVIFVTFILHIYSSRCCLLLCSLHYWIQSLGNLCLGGKRQQLLQMTGSVARKTVTGLAKENCYSSFTESSIG